MDFGALTFTKAIDARHLVAASVLAGIIQSQLEDAILVAKIDPSLADTAAFCEHYEIAQGVSANCVIVEAKRADRVWYAACMVLATTRADVNGAIRRHLDARKISFASMDTAVKLSEMEYGGITPIGLPADWPILIDEAVADQTHVVIGSGIRGSKLLVEPKFLRVLPGALVLTIAK
jgi:prolyl-tRNA editing enzyme YbaK/EbsC (Cys-tRNA(Pro) deacylase)